MGRLNAITHNIMADSIALPNMGKAITLLRPARSDHAPKNSATKSDGALAENTMPSCIKEASD